MLSDRQIRQYVKTHGMIDPFAEGEDRPGIISYGLTSRGYDFRVSRKLFKVFCNSFGNVIVDPKNFDPRSFVEFKDVDFVIIPPNSFCLCESVEYFRMPRELVADCVGKSTLARCGLILNMTPIESEWEGILTVEMSNTTPLPAKLYAGEGIGQMRFFRSDDPEGCERSYKDKKGRYDRQQGLTLPFVR